MKKLLIGVGLALALVAVMPHGASAQVASGATDIDITLNGIIILHYYGNVDVTITATAMGAFLGGPNIDEGVGTDDGDFVGGDFVADLEIVPSGITGDPTSANLVLQNAWAVRALASPGTNVRVQGSVTGNPLGHQGVGGESIDITSATPTPGLFPSPGLVSPQFGSVTLALDFTNATAAGTYDNGGTYTLDVDLI